jgi:Acyclic terpene utilisation family protein AtuA
MRAQCSILDGVNRALQPDPHAVRQSIRIGCGAGFSGDRIEPAIELATHGDLNFLVFECLVERTIALAQHAKATDPTAGYDPLFDARMLAVVPACRARGTRIITNMGCGSARGAIRSR